MSRPAPDRASVRPRTGDDDGFTLVEVVVALFLLGMVATAVLVFFVRGMQTSSHLQRNQSASVVAAESMERVRGVSVKAAAGLPTALLVGRAKADVDAVWTAAAPVDTAQSEPLWDPAATNSDNAAVKVIETVTRSDIRYTVTNLIGRCYRAPSGSGASQPCTKAKPLDGVEMYRATVVVTWKPTSTGQCKGAPVCTYRMSSLFDPTPDATWNVSAKPVAYDDDNGEMVAGDAAADFPVMSNDVIGAYTSNPISITVPPTLGAGSSATTVGAGSPAVWMVRYKPPTNASGIETLSYQLRDGAGRPSNPGVVSITVKPKAVADAFTVEHGKTTSITVLSNDRGTFTSPTITVSAPVNVIAPNPAPGVAAVQVTPVAGKSVGEFTYTVNDGESDSLPVKVSLTFTTPVPVKPATGDLDLAVIAGIPGTVQNLNMLAQPALSGNGAGHTLEVVTGLAPNVGLLTGSGSAALSYRPADGQIGLYSFTFLVRSPTGTASDTKTARITVHPVAKSDGLSLSKGRTGTVASVAANDAPASGMTITFGSVTQSATGVCTNVTPEASGKVTVTAGTRTGTCTVPYTISKVVSGLTLTSNNALTVTVS